MYLTIGSLFGLCMTAIAQSDGSDISKLREKVLSVSGKQQLEVFIDLVKKYDDIDIDSAFYFCNRAIKLAQEIQADSALGIAYYQLGKLYYDKDEYENSLSNYRRALPIFKETKQERYEARTFRRIGMAESKQGDYEKAIDSYQKTYEYGVLAKDTTMLTLALNNLGISYKNIGDYSNALKNYFDALQIRQHQGKERRYATLYNNIGVVYKAMNEQDKALEYYEKAYALNVKHKKRSKTFSNLLNIGAIYKDNKEYDKALESYNKAIQVAKEDNKLVDLGKAYNNLGSLFGAQDLTEKAIKNYEISLKYKRKIGDKKGIATTSRNLANRYLKLNQLAKALLFAKEAYGIDTTYNLKSNILSDYETLAKVYSAMGNYKRAFEFRGLYIELNEELFDDKKVEQLLSLENDFEKEKQSRLLLDAENRILQQQKDLADSKVNRSYFMLLFFGLLLLGAAFYLYFQRFQQQKKDAEIIQTTNLKLEKSNTELLTANQQLENYNTELEQFTHIASHDLREPSRLTANFVSLLKRRYSEELPKGAMEYIDYIDANARRMYILVSDLLEYLTSSKKTGDLEVLETEAIVREVLSTLSNKIEARKAHIEIKSLPNIKMNKFQLKQLFQNLIGNGIKYQAKGVLPQIVVDCKSDENQHVFSVKDNGIGIEKEFADKIFEIFKRLHGKGQYEGTGIGLAICKRIIEQYNGEIWVESEKGKGSTFYFSIPS